MHDVIRSLGAQMNEGIALTTPMPTAPSRIICCGMGGSSTAGELLSLVRANVIVHWDWNLPEMATKDDLIICTSWSGATHETLSSYDAARALGAQLAVIATGGELAERARRDGVPLTLIPTNPNPPRFNLGLMVGALFSFAGMPQQLRDCTIRDSESEGRALASAIGSATPVFYTSYPLRKIAGFFKTLINENAKRHAWSGSFPSIAHNEVMGWSTRSHEYIPCVLRGTPERDTDTRDIEAYIALMREMGYTVPIIGLSGASTLEQALNAYATALWASWYVASDAGIDVRGTPLIDALKQLKGQV